MNIGRITKEQLIRRRSREIELQNSVVGFLLKVHSTLKKISKESLNTNKTILWSK
jgi:hypothetical protein